MNKKPKKKFLESDQKDPSKLKAEADDAAAAGHDDAAQDIELIKKMLKDTLGDDVASSEEAVKMAHEMFGRAKKAGESHEEAMSCAKYGMKAAKHQSESEKQSEGESEDEGKKDAPKEAKKEDESEGDEGSKEASEDESEKESEDEGKHESNAKAKGEVEILRERVVTLAAENNKYKAKEAKKKYDEQLDGILKESKLDNATTKSIREMLVELNLKTIEQAKSVIAKFKAAAPAGIVEDEGFAYAIEKTAHISESGAEGSGFDFSGCINE